jgi:hypothetical protein
MPRAPHLRTLARQWGQGIGWTTVRATERDLAPALRRGRGRTANFFLRHDAALVINVFTFKALPYDPRRDFVPVGMMG